MFFYNVSQRSESCRAAMMEFEINLSEMPLGKLSKNNIQKGASIYIYHMLLRNTSVDLVLVNCICLTFIKKLSSNWLAFMVIFFFLQVLRL